MNHNQPTNTAPSIGIWGPTKSGKTSYIAGIKIALDNLNQRWKIWAETPDTKRFLETQWADLARGIFPASTDVSSPITYNFHLYKKDTFLGTNGQFHNIIVIDAAGQLILDPDDRFHYFEKLAQCQGIILFIDPETNREMGQPSPVGMDEPYHKLLLRLIHKLHERRTDEGDLDINLAFCLTKVDLDPHWDNRETPEEYLEQILGRVALSGIKPFCAPDKTRFFATSVAGRYITPAGVSRSNVYEEDGVAKIADLTKWEPYKLLDPLFWLFDRIEAEKNANEKNLIKRVLRSRLREKNYKEDTDHGKS